MMFILDSSLDSTRREESVCMTIAVVLHALMLLWNPAFLTSDYKPIHDFVTIDVVDQSGAGGGGGESAAPKKASLMDTLKDMLMKPRSEDIAHVAPEPVTHQVAAPVQPALQNKNMPRQMTFQPKSQTEDLAATSAPNAIKTNEKNINIPAAGPTLKTKEFGGIRAKDLPFQVGTDQQIAGGNASVIPVAIGNGSAKAALGYSGPTLKDSGKHAGISPTAMSGPAGDMNAIGGGGPQTIQLSGTGGTGNAPTGAAHGSVLNDRSGTASGGRGYGFGNGGRGGGFGSGVEGIPSAAADLDAQIASDASNAGRGPKNKKGFDIAGPLNNRPILHKVIPPYPAWAEEQGIIGSVRIWFTVTSEGTVRSNMRVTKTTGYPDLDKLALDALKQWTFAVSNTGDDTSQWGIITFTFSLSS